MDGGKNPPSNFLPPTNKKYLEIKFIHLFFVTKKMARVNVGVNPKYLSDQHLMAEAVEILMVVGSLKKQKFTLKKPTPKYFKLGTGHIRFFWDKILFLHRRLNLIKKEIELRGMQSNHQINLAEIPPQFINDWSPSENDLSLLKERISLRLKSPLKGGNNFHKYYGKPITNISDFISELNNSVIVK